MEVLLEARQARLGKNQSLFRAVNEEVETLSVERASGGPISFVCECANPDCAGRIELSLRDYEAIRQNSTRFLVLSNHVFPDVETVVDDRGGYVIVEKFGEGGRVAEATDSRPSAP